MSTPVEAHERLRSEAAERGATVFLLTVGDDSRPHAVAVTAAWDGDAAVLAAGRSSTANATARPAVSLLWPPDEPGGYSLIVDGEAMVEPLPDGGRLTVRPTRAVLHRPAQASDDPPAPEGVCGSDCVPLLRRPK